MQQFRIRAFFLLIALLVAGCAEPPPRDLVGTWVGYGAIADDRLLPMRAYLDLSPDSLSGYFLVAGERTGIPEMSLRGDSLRLDFREYGASMTGRLDANRYTGRYVRVWGDTTSFPFVLFFDEEDLPAPPVDASVGGTYRALFGSGDEAQSSSIAVLDVKEGRLSGTIIDSGGDYGLLEGVQGNGTIQLFRFTGWQALYFELTESEIGYRGRFQERAEPALDIAFIRTGDDARERERTTSMKDPGQPFLFSGLTSSGQILTSQDSNLRGKPLIIDIMGTWCHNCLDAAPLLQRSMEQHAADSLQIISLSFEVQDDAVAGLQNLERFRERFGITYPILYCGSLDEENVTARLRHQLNDFFSYPTTIFVNRAGKVTDIHTGFNGPGTGPRWEQQLIEFESALQIILEN